MWNRFKRWLFLFGVAITQGIFNTTFAGLWWVLTGRGSEPDPDQPLSSRVGRAAYQNKKWGLFLESIIDFIFGKGHCYDSAVNYYGEL